MGRITGAQRIGLALAIVVPLGIAGCSEDDAKRSASDPSAAPAADAALSAVALEITPAARAKNLPVSTEVGTKVGGGKVTAVTLREAGGKTISGTMRDDGSSWVPARPLTYAKSYTASVTAVGDGGQAATRATTFTTMKKPSRQTGTGLYLFSGNTYGVAMPVVVEFIPGIAKKDRASVQRRMFVRTSPVQLGTWHWVENGTQAYYRAPKYWQPGTKLSVRIAVGGHPTGQGRYGNVDRAATSKIGRKLEMKVNNRDKRLRVYQDGKQVRSYPVSLGKRSTPSSSGTMVIMQKEQTTVFDTFAELGASAGYRTSITYAHRLTWGGEFLHAAPWSVGSQGRRNVSHGCVNVSTSNAQWLFRNSLVGDPITVKGTERTLEDGNGWTAWNLTWAEFIKTSALPLPAELKPGASPSPAPAASPSVAKTTVAGGW